MADMAHLEAGVEEESYIDLPKAYHETGSQLSLLKKVMIEEIQDGAQDKRVWTSPGRPMRVPADTQRNGCRHIASVADDKLNHD